MILPKRYSLIVLMSTLSSFAKSNNKRYVKAKQETLQKAVSEHIKGGVSLRTIQRHLASLRDSGMIDIIQRKKRHSDGTITSLANIYRFKPRFWQFVHAIGKKFIRLLSLTDTTKLSSNSPSRASYHTKTGRERSERAGFLPNGDLFIPGVGQLKPASAFKH